MQINDNMTPLAERCRPAELVSFVGQRHLTDEGKLIKNIVDNRTAVSMILWGDPGSGKTTLALLIAKQCLMESYILSAISAGVSDVRKVIAKGKENREKGIATLLFLDEIHRFNKAQQDAVLGAVESGDIVLIGATTENPSFSIIAPLLSRTRVVKLNRLEEDDLKKILISAIENDSQLKGKASMKEGVVDKLVAVSSGDARRMFNLFETAFSLSHDGVISDLEIDEALKNSAVYYDRAGDRHYDTISAFIKSMRGSDPDAAVYYLAKMIAGGEDPVFIARRMVIFSSEDIGNASPVALNIAVSTMTAVSNIGLPEAEIVLSQCAVFLASAPKSNASYRAIKDAKVIASKTNYEIPMHIRNAPTDLMKKQGYGAGYKYPHEHKESFVKENYLPSELKGRMFYSPSDQGSEKAIKERLKILWPERYE